MYTPASKAAPQAAAVTCSSPVGTARTAPRPGSGGTPAAVSDRRSSSPFSRVRAIRSGSLRRMRRAASAAPTEAGSVAALNT